MLWILALVACGEPCATVIEVETTPDGATCTNVADPGDCCPDGWEWLGATRTGASVCWVPECLDVVEVAVAPDGADCVGDSCCPDGYGYGGDAYGGAPVCVEE